eukprot:210408_1
MKDESAGIPLQVCLRVRPSSDGSTDHFKICSNSDKKDDSILILAPEESSAFRNGERGEVRFSFSTIFGPNDDQQKIFASLGPTIIENLLNGQNGLVFAYGMTNSGKTYTIDGSSENPGFLPSLLTNLFQQLSERFEEKSEKSSKMEVDSGGDQAPLDVHVSYLEVYLDNVIDLLDEQDGEATSLEVRSDPANGVFIPGLRELAIRSSEEATELLRRGAEKRNVGATNLNKHSSRSHAVFTLKLCFRDTGECLSRLSVVDLAGAERTARAGTQQLPGRDRFDESVKINSSLTVIGRCLENMRYNQKNPTKPQRTIPFRETKITRLLQDHLEGNGLTVMVVNVNLCRADYDETSRVLKYASVARDVKCMPRVQTWQATTAHSPLLGSRRKGNPQDSGPEYTDEQLDVLQLIDEQVELRHIIRELHKRMALREFQLRAELVTGFLDEFRKTFNGFMFAKRQMRDRFWTRIADLAGELEKLWKLRDSLQTELKSKTESLNDVTAKHDSLVKRLEESKAQHEHELGSSTEKMDIQLTESRRRCSILETKSTTFKNTAEKMEEDLKTTRKSCREFLDQINQLQSELEISKRDLATSKSTHALISERFEDEKLRADLAEEKFNELKSDFEDNTLETETKHKSEIDALSSLCSKLKVELSQSQNNENILELQLRALKKNESEKQSDESDLHNSQISSYNSQISSLQHALNESNTINSDLRHSRDELRKEREKSRMELREMSEIETSLRLELAKSSEKLSSSNTQLANSNERITQLEFKISDKSRKVKYLTEELDSKSHDIEELVGELRKFRENDEKLSEELELSRSESFRKSEQIADLTSEFKKYEFLSKRLSSDMESNTSKLNNQIAQRDSQIESLNHAVEDSRSESSQKSAQIDMLNNHIGELELKLGDSNVRFAELEHKIDLQIREAKVQVIADQRIEQDEFQLECDQLRSKVESDQIEIQSLKQALEAAETRANQAAADHPVAISDVETDSSQSEDHALSDLQSDFDGQDGTSHLTDKSEKDTVIESDDSNSSNSSSSSDGEVSVGHFESDSAELSEPSLDDHRMATQPLTDNSHIGAVDHSRVDPSLSDLSGGDGHPESSPGSITFQTLRSNAKPKHAASIPSQTESQAIVQSQPLSQASTSAQSSTSSQKRKAGEVEDTQSEDSKKKQKIPIRSHNPDGTRRSEAQITRMIVVDLRNELRAANLSTCGKKSVLVRRMLEAMQDASASVFGQAMAAKFVAPPLPIPTVPKASSGRGRAQASSSCISGNRGRGRGRSVGRGRGRGRGRSSGRVTRSESRENKSAEVKSTRTRRQTRSSAAAANLVEPVADLSDPIEISSGSEFSPSPETKPKRAPRTRRRTQSETAASQPARGARRGRRRAGRSTFDPTASEHTTEDPFAYPEQSPKKASKAKVSKRKIPLPAVTEEVSQSSKSSPGSTNSNDSSSIDDEKDADWKVTPRPKKRKLRRRASRDIIDRYSPMVREKPIKSEPSRNMSRRNVTRRKYVF